MRLALIRKYTRLYRKKQEQQVKLTKLNKELAEAKQKVIDDLIKAEVQRIELGGFLVFLRTTIRARAANQQQAVKALLDAGLPEFLLASPQRLSAWVRELMDKGEELPEGLKAHVLVTEVPDLGVNTVQRNSNGAAPAAAEVATDEAEGDAEEATV